MMKMSDCMSLSCLQHYNHGLDWFCRSHHDSDISMAMCTNIDGELGTGMDCSYPEHLGYGSLDVAPDQCWNFPPAMYSPFMPTAVDNLVLAPPPASLTDFLYCLPCDSSIIKSEAHLIQPCEPAIKTEKNWTPRCTTSRRKSSISNITSEASTTIKKRKAIEQLIDVQLQVPVKRSQKLSDKIAALQELVCPYGKTDTASVLHDACIHIRIVHQELQRLCISYFETRSFASHVQGNALKQVDLRSKGLCLVPVSIMKSLTKEGWGEQQQAASRTSRRYRNT